MDKVTLTTDSPSRKLVFFDLPPEIRCMIYSHLLRDLYLVFVTPPPSSRPVPTISRFRLRRSGIFGVSNVFTVEVSRNIFSEAIFRFSPLRQSSPPLFDEQIDRIMRVQFDVMDFNFHNSEPYWLRNCRRIAQHADCVRHCAYYQYGCDSEEVCLSRIRRFAGLSIKRQTCEISIKGGCRFEYVLGRQPWQEAIASLVGFETVILTSIMQGGNTIEVFIQERDSTSVEEYFNKAFTVLGPCVTLKYSSKRQYVFYPRKYLAERASKAITKTDMSASE